LIVVLLVKTKWSPERQRKFFDEFAKSNNFSPLDADKWYLVTLQQIRKAVCVKNKNVLISYFVFKGGRKLLFNYNHSHVKALILLYPELHLKKANFSCSKGYQIT
jgi:hypothetical protein